MRKRIVCLVLCLAPLGAWGAVTGPAEVFVPQISLPEGVATDADGSVYAFHDAVNFKAVSKFLPDGTADGFVSVGNFFSAALGGRLSRHPVRGTLLLLLSTGEILEVDQRSSAVSTFIDLRGLTLDADNVYDMSVAGVRDLSGSILASNIEYGDIDVLDRGSALDVFVSGLSLSTPFVARVRITSNGAGTVKVLVASAAGTPGTNNLTRGVAVSPQGAVLTTMPASTLGALELQDHGVAFSADFDPDTPGQSLPSFVLGTNELKSRGMTADGAGNFYIATGSRGISACGAGGSGALVVVPADFSALSCHNLNVALADSTDVAVNQANDRAYMTVNNIGAVVAFPLSVSEQPAAAPNQGATTAGGGDAAGDGAGGGGGGMGIESVLLPGLLIGARSRYRR